MDSTKFFLKKTCVLKETIYNKYKINFEDIKNKLFNSLLKIYGARNINILEEKLSQIHLINFYSVLDLWNHFEIPSSYFNPIVLGPESTLPPLTEFDKKQLELENSFNELLGDYEEPQKPYDKDIAKYVNECTSYKFSLEDETLLKNFMQPLTKNQREKIKIEYLINSSMYSFCKKSLDELNLILKSDINYQKILNILSICKKSFLLNNINYNFEKVDIIFLNPFLENEYDIFNLIRNIILSINTNVSVINNNYVFKNGICQSFEKHDCDIDFIIEHGSEYNNLSNFINNFIIYDVIEDMQNTYITLKDNISVDIPNYSNKSEIRKFYEKYKNLIIDSLILNDDNILFKEIGKEKYEALARDCNLAN